MDTVRPRTFADLEVGERFRIAPDGPTEYVKVNEGTAARRFASAASPRDRFPETVQVIAAYADCP